MDPENVRKPVNIGSNSLPKSLRPDLRRSRRPRKRNKTGAPYRFLLRAVFTDDEVSSFKEARFIDIIQDGRRFSPIPSVGTPVEALPYEVAEHQDAVPGYGNYGSVYYLNDGALRVVNDAGFVVTILKTLPKDDPSCEYLGVMTRGYYLPSARR